MNSPFEIFRKHQKAAMVILVFMAMFAFIVLDSVQRASGSSMQGFTVAIALGILLAGIFWVVGNPKKQGKEYAALGLVIGIAAGLIGPMLNRPAPAFSSTIGTMSRQELDHEVTRRHRANNFLQVVSQRMGQRYLKQHPKATEREVPRMNPGYLFQLFPRTSVEQDVAFKKVFLHEADQLGIQVSDEAVRDYLKKAADGKLYQEDFREALRQVQLSEDELYEIVREELRARLAWDCLRPRLCPVPDDYWKIYRQLNVREELEVAAVPVSAFTAQIDDPSQQDLEAFFKAHSTTLPSRQFTDQPAFAQPRKVQIAFVKAGTDQFEGAVSTALDKEIAAAEAAGKPTPIEKFYEQNKERYRNPTMPAKTPPKDGPKLSAPDLPGSESDKKEPEKTDAPKSDDAKPDNKKHEDKKPDEAKPEEKKPEEKKDEPKSEEKPAEDKKPEGSDELSDQLEDEQEEKPAETPKAEEKKADESKPEPKADDKKPGEAKTAEDPATPAALTDEAKADAPATAEIPGEPLPEDTLADPLPEFQPLDDKLKSEIRRQIINDRVAARLDSKIRKAEEEMTKRADEIHAAMLPQPGQRKSDKKVDHEAISTDLKAWASANDFRYGVTDLISIEELANPDEHPIGAAAENSPDPFNARSVAMQAGQSDPKQIYFPSVAIDRITGNRYCWWKVDDVAARPGELTDKGMREKVIAAWKAQQARKPTEDRANAIAEKVRKAESKPMADVLAGETVTGKEGSLLLTVRETEPFTWLRRGVAPPQNPFASPPPELSTISAVDKADDKFMETIFQTLKDGETGVAPNADKSIYYVVRVKNRVPSTEAGEEEMRKQFLASRDDFFPDPRPFMRMFRQSPYVQILEQEQATLFMDWQRSIAEKYKMTIGPRQAQGEDAETPMEE